MRAIDMSVPCHSFRHTTKNQSAITRHARPGTEGGLRAASSRDQRLVTYSSQSLVTLSLRLEDMSIERCDRVDHCLDEICLVRAGH